MNSKGFTMIELLGVIVILSIIMLIAIPSVSSTLERSKKDTYIADARKMAALVQTEIRKGKIAKPTGELVVKLGNLGTDQILKDPDGYNYDTDKSYVKIRVENGYVVYRVQLLTSPKNNGKYRGIRETDVDNLESNDRYKQYVNNISLS